MIDHDGHLMIAKFPAPTDDWPVPRWEMVAMTLARAAGIVVPNFALHTIQKRPVFLMRRFDRDDQGGCIPFISALTALAASDGETRSYLELVDVLRTDGATPEQDAAELWRRMVFNILISNTDDHLRNHGYLRDAGGWRLAPAYDLRRYHDSILHSAGDLNAFLGCAHAVVLNARALDDAELRARRAVDDGSVRLTQDAGHTHEAAYRETLDGVVTIADSGSLEGRAAATADAMRAGANVIYQATLLDAAPTPIWHGFADFLRRVEIPSRLGAWSYEAVDTKLARSVKPSHVLQLGLYSDMVAQVQGGRPHAMHVVLGNGREETFRAVEFRHTLDAAKARYLAFVADEAATSVAEPCAACTLCAWRDECAAEWEAADHLSLVAGLGAPQRLKLRAAGIDTVAALAATPPGTRVAKMVPATFERLRDQAAMQVERQMTGHPNR